MVLRHNEPFQICFFEFLLFISLVDTPCHSMNPAFNKMYVLFLLLFHVYFMPSFPPNSLVRSYWSFVIMFFKSICRLLTWSMKVCVHLLISFWNQLRLESLIIMSLLTTIDFSAKYRNYTSIHRASFSPPAFLLCLL